MGLSDKQLKFICESQKKLNFAHGAVRSGKTFCTLVRWAEFVKTAPPGDFIMTGYSFDTVFYNTVQLFMKMFDGYCSWSPGNHVLTFGDKTIRVLGAHDQSSYRSIQGMTLHGAYCDEMTSYPQNFLDMLYSRLSPSFSKLFGTMNPDSPHHSIKKLIDEDPRVYALHFQLDDNPDLDPDYKEFIKGLYSGLWYRRYVLGEWVQAEGAIYDSWDRKDHIFKRLPAPEYYIVGVDVGSSNPFGAVLIGFNSKVQPFIAVHKEYYWNPKETGRQKTNAEFADDLDRFCDGYPIRCIYVDPAAESFEVEIRKRKRIVKEANNDVFNGISSVANYIAGRNLGVHEDCKNLIKEIEGYSWDPKKTKLGEDAPIKVNDHLCDALRYAVYTHFGNRKIADPAKPNTGSIFKAGTGGPENGWGWQTFNGGPPQSPPRGFR